MNEYSLVSLDASTWDLFAELVERDGGIVGGCWCIGYHPACGQKGIDHRAVKADRVRSVRAHHAMVVDAGGIARGWCQWGDPEELSNIKHRRKYDQDSPPRLDRRITCIFVDKRHRGQGIARMALEGAWSRSLRRAGDGWRRSPKSPPGVRLMSGSCSAAPSSSWRTSDSSGCGKWASTRGSPPSGPRRRGDEPRPSPLVGRGASRS